MQILCIDSQVLRITLCSPYPNTLFSTTLFFQPQRNPKERKKTRVIKHLEKDGEPSSQIGQLPHTIGIYSHQPRHQ